jgi:hypothetical protein
MILKNSLLLCFYILGISFQAQSQKTDIIKALALPYSYKEVKNIIDKCDTIIGTINPSKSSYLVSSYFYGIQLEFSFNMILNSIVLHDNGTKYKRYTDSLPLGLRWGLNQETLTNKKYLFDLDSTNPYQLRRELEIGTITAYLGDGKLISLKLEAKPDLVKKADEQNLQQWGIRVFPDGEIKKGNCISDFGIMFYSDESSYYEGEWLYGFPNGKGKFVSPDGASWEGDFVQGFPWGKVKIIAPNAFEYYGDVLFGKRNGAGTIKYSTGERYEGDWVNNNMQGNGKYSFALSYRYVGEFSNGKFNGRGALDTPEGLYEGGFKDGKPHGKGTQKVFRTQATLKGNWVNGKKEGTFTYQDALTQTKTITYINDIEVVK